MDKKDFRKLQEKVKMLLNHTKKQDFERGIDITSDKYKEALLLLEDKILAKLGLTREEYNTLKAQFAGKSAKQAITEVEERITTRISELPQSPSTEAIKGLISDSINQIPKIEPKIVNNTKIIKEIVKEKPVTKVVRETIKEVDETKLDKLSKDLFFLQESFGQHVDKIQRDLKVPYDFMAGFDGMMTNKITSLVSPELNRVVRSLQGQIYFTNKRLEDLISAESDPVEDNRYLHLDQTITQNIINGLPNFSLGLYAGDAGFAKLYASATHSYQFSDYTTTANDCSNFGHNANGYGVGASTFGADTVANDGASAFGKGAQANGAQSTAIGGGTIIDTDNMLGLGGYNPTLSVYEPWLTILPGTVANTPAVSIGSGSFTGGAITGSSLKATGLTTSLGVYTGTGGILTTTPPTSGILGYWTRSGIIISTATAGDTIATTGQVNTPLVYHSSTLTLQGTGASILLEDNSIIFGDATDNDITLTFNGLSGVGYLKWMEDEDYFQFLDDIMLSGGENIILSTTTGTKIGTATSQLLGFYNATPVNQPNALTAGLTTITYTAPGTPDYAIQNFTQTTPFGFVTADEANTVLKVIENLQIKVAELEARLEELGLVAAN
jgi:hypothetical protein